MKRFQGHWARKIRRNTIVTVDRIVGEDPGDEKDKEGDEGTGDEKEICTEVTHVTRDWGRVGNDWGEEVDLIVVILDLRDSEVHDKE